MEKDRYLEALEKGTQDRMNFGSNLLNHFEKGKKAQIGEIRTWNGQKVQKTYDGWKPVKEMKKFDLEEADIEGMADGTISEEALSNLPEGTEIHLKGYANPFVKDGDGNWLVSGNTYRSAPYSSKELHSVMQNFYGKRVPDIGWKDVYNKTMVPKKEQGGVASMSDIKSKFKQGIVSAKEIDELPVGSEIIFSTGAIWTKNSDGKWTPNEKVSDMKPHTSKSMASYFHLLRKEGCLEFYEDLKVGLSEAEVHNARVKEISSKLDELETLVDDFAENGKFTYGEMYTSFKKVVGLLQEAKKEFAGSEV